MNAVFDRLSKMFSKEFAVASFLPVVIVGLLNVCVAYSQSRWFRTLIDERLSSTSTFADQLVSVAAALLAAAVLAFFFSLWRNVLRLALEGRYWFPGRVAAAAYHSARVEKSQQRLNEANQAFVLLGVDFESWKSQLRGDRIRRADPGKQCDYDESDLAARQIACLEHVRAKRAVISYPAAKKAKDALRAALERNPVDSSSSDDRQRLLRDHHGAYLSLLEYAYARSGNETDRLSSELQMSYADDDPAPTALGNIARAMHGYPRRRYGFGLDDWWSRLEHVARDKEVYEPFSAARAKLDAVISFFWLVSSSTALWAVYLGLRGYHPRAYLCVVALGGAASIMSYAAALRAYRALSETARAIVDLYRRALLQKMSVQPPLKLEEEREVWKALDEHLKTGSLHHVRFQSPK